jgi:capsular exopolysaccharide synthesis family protein
VLRRRWLLILGIVTICLLVAVARHERAAKSYRATASVTFQVATLPDAALQVSPSGSEPQRAADTEVLIAQSSRVAEGVRSELHTSDGLSELLAHITVEAAPNADVLDIVAKTGDPRYSARLANAFAKQYIAFKAAAQVSSIEEAEHRLQEQIAALPAGSPARASLEQSQQRLGGLRAVAGGGANIISLATAPTSSFGMSLSTTAVIGILVGLAIALSVIFLLESLDRRVKAIEEFEHEYRLPALAVVPQSAFGAARADQRSALLEPYRILRSALDFTAVTRQLDSLLVTSAMPGEGKTTVAVDLAHAIALTGRNVVLAEFDLRRPTFAQHFNVHSPEGLTTALTRGEGGMGLLVQPFPNVPNLSVLTSGRLPPNPSELLASGATAKILGELMRSEGLLVIDAPPLNAVSDAQVLLNNAMIHAVLLVARMGKTTREQVRRARAILDRHGTEPVGIVVTGLRDAGSYGYESYGSIDPTLDSANVRTLSRPKDALSRPASMFSRAARESPRGR